MALVTVGSGGHGRKSDDSCGDLGVIGHRGNIFNGVIIGNYSLVMASSACFITSLLVPYYLYFYQFFYLLTFFYFLFIQFFFSFLSIFLFKIAGFFWGGGG